MPKPQSKLQVTRHGDICLVKISKLPKGLKASDTKVLMQSGSSGNPHSFDNGIFYPATEEHDFIIGYLKAKNASFGLENVKWEAEY